MRKDKYTLEDLWSAKCYADKCMGTNKVCSECITPCKLCKSKDIVNNILESYYKECLEYYKCINHYIDVVLVQDLGLSTIMKNRLEKEGLLTDASVYSRVKTDNGFDWEVLRKMRGCGPKTFSGIVDFFKDYFEKKHFETYSDMIGNKDLKMLGFLLKFTSFKSLKDIVQYFYNPIEDDINVDKLDRLIYDLGKNLVFSGRTYGVYNGNDGDFCVRVEHLVMRYRFLYSKEATDNEEV